MSSQKFFVITGQTATGKTALAIKYAIEFDGEIISADSRQVYRHLDVVTGKDSQKYNDAGVATHLIDVADPKERFSSHEFVGFAQKAIEDIQKRNKSVIIVGGTYLYIKHLLYGFDVAVPPNEELRTTIESKSLKELQEMVGEDHGMNESDYMNPRRLIRKIEILSHETSDKLSATEHQSYDITEYIGLRYAEKEQLEQAIRRRVEARIHAGALDETKKLLEAGYTKTDPSLSGIGYAQLIRHIEGEYSLELATQEWATKELQYAKRQHTFMKNDGNIEWLIV